MKPASSSIDILSPRQQNYDTIHESALSSYINTKKMPYSYYLSNFLDSPGFIIFMSLTTVWSIFSTDVRGLLVTQTSDYYFRVVITFVFVLFFIEIVLSVYSKPEYIKLPNKRRRNLPTHSWIKAFRRKILFGSFYFWMDIITQISFVVDFAWSFELPIFYNNLEAITAGACMNRGSSIGRWIRLGSVFSLVRIERLFKYFSIISKPEDEKRQKSSYYAANQNYDSANDYSDHEGILNDNHNQYQYQRQQAQPQLMYDDDDDDDDDDYIQQSHVGSKMTDLTNQRVLVLVFSLLIAIPALTVSTTNTSLDLATRMVFNMGYNNYTNPKLYSNGLQLAIQNTVASNRVIQIAFQTASSYEIVYQNLKIAENVRQAEIVDYYQQTNDQQFPFFRTQISFDQSDVVRTYALYNIFTALFFINLLLFGAFFVWYDIHKLVIDPVNRLVVLVKRISANPLADNQDMGKEEGFREGLETTTLLTNILKIAKLMRVGFGEAGASVIANNLQRSSGGTLTLVGPGTLIHSIFGFCDVRQFTDTTECLQEEVMLFVNRIAHILHGIVVQCSGQANKNIGDAFLLTWKIDEKDYGTEKGMRLADLALIAFLRTLVELIKHEAFIINFSKLATERLEKRFPDYSVRIGCGLHYGWAVEGAIGSQRKIDASYLSPHVNFTEFLESSTKTYGVPIIMSEPFYKMLSPVASKYCRQIDRILRTESQGPIGLYTYDADLSINYADTKRKRSYPTKRYSSTTIIKKPRPSLLRRTPTKGLGRHAIIAKSTSEDVKQSMSASGSGSSSNLMPADGRESSAANRSTGSSSLGRLGKWLDATMGGVRRGSHTSTNANTNRPRNGLASSIGSVDEETGGICSGSGGSGFSPINPILGRANSSERRRKNIANSMSSLINNYASFNGSNVNTTRGGGVAVNSATGDDEEDNAPEIIVSEYYTEIWEEDDELLELRHQYNGEFVKAWQAGVANYINGQWVTAARYFKETLNISKNQDGPSKFLLGYMMETNNEVPEDWQSYRMEGTS